MPSTLARILVPALLLSAGCETTVAKQPPAQQQAAKADTPAAKQPEHKNLKIASWDEAKKIIAEQKGKIVVVDFWSTWCEPCVKEYPHLVKLQAAHPKDVVCIAINCNYIGTGKPDDDLPDIAKFITEQKAERLLNLVSSEADEELYKKIGIASVPVAQVYDRDGKLAKQFDNESEAYGKGGFTYEKHIAPYVQSLVKPE